MRSRLTFIVLALLIIFITPSLVLAQEDEHHCDHTPTIAALHDCVEHALMMGHIDNKGIANALLSKLDAAQSALNRGQTEVAINNLEAFINQVQAQSGKHIEAEHADHLVMHTQAVIQALTN